MSKDDTVINKIADIIQARLDEGLDVRLIAEYVVEGLRKDGIQILSNDDLSYTKIPFVVIGSPTDGVATHPGPQVASAGFI